MNIDEIRLAKRGARLLTGHIRNKGERLEQFDESGDFRRCEECADPLVLIAAILVQSLARELDVNFDAALAREIERTDAADSPQVAGAAVVISCIGNGTLPPPIQVGPTSVAYGAQFIGDGAAKALSSFTGDRPEKVVGQLKTKIARNDNTVQFLNSELASATIRKLAEDIEVGKIRTEATYEIASLFNETSNMLYRTAIAHDGHTEMAPEPRLFGAASLLVTATSLIQGGG